MTDKIVFLRPDCISSRLQESQRKTTKGIYYKFSYYVKFDKNTHNAYLTDNEAEEIRLRFSTYKNSPTDIFEISKNDLTPEIVKHFRFVQPFIDYEQRDINIPPYILGLWLGDGDSAGPNLTSIDLPIIDAWSQYANNIGYRIRIHHTDRKNSNKDGESETVQHLRIVKGIPSDTSNISMGKPNLKPDTQGRYICKYCHIQFSGYQGLWSHMKNRLQSGLVCLKSENVVKTYLKNYSLLNNKHIPIVYLKNSKDVRLELLAGLLDTDGYLEKGSHYSIIQKNKQLADDIVILCQSLGFYTKMKETRKSCIYKEEKKEGIYYLITIFNSMMNLQVIPVRLERKRMVAQEKTQNRYNPLINVMGDPIEEKCRVQWTETMKIRLYSITCKIKKLIPGKPIPWNIYGDLDEMFKGISPRALDTMYYKNLCIEKDKYDASLMDMNFSLDDLSDPNWIRNTDRIKTLHDSGYLLTKEENGCLYNWLYSQKRKKFRTDQIQLVDSLLDRNREIAEEQWERDWFQQFSKLSEWIKTHMRTPREGKLIEDDEERTIGDFYKCIKKRISDNNLPANCKNAVSELIKDYGSIIEKGNNKKPINVILSDGNYIFFQTQNACANYFDVSKSTIMHAIKHHKMVQGATLWIEDV
jgi:hypothetical protein